MPRPSALTTAALATFGVVLAACAIPDIAVEPADPVPTTGTTTPAPGPSGTSLEGRFTFETMDVYVREVLGHIHPWMRDTWPSMPLPEVVYVLDGDSGRTSCTDHEGRPARYTGDSYEYCPPDTTVYLGQNTLWLFYRRTGDAGPAMGIAHEFAHHVQYQLDIPPPFTNEQSIEFENQADCIAGAWTRHVEQRDFLEPNDLEDIEQLLPLIASAESEGDDRDHGTLEEREEEFTDGFLGGVRACGVSEE
jgi:hypothetical protein